MGSIRRKCLDLHSFISAGTKLNLGSRSADEARVRADGAFFKRGESWIQVTT